MVNLYISLVIMCGFYKRLLAVRELVRCVLCFLNNS